MKRIWNYLNGKKTVIGLTMQTLFLIAHMLKPSIITVPIHEVGQIALGSITGLGLGHKVTKFGLVKQWINTIKK